MRDTTRWEGVFLGTLEIHDCYWLFLLFFLLLELVISSNMLRGEVCFVLYGSSYGISHTHPLPTHAMFSMFLSHDFGFDV